MLPVTATRPIDGAATYGPDLDDEERGGASMTMDLYGHLVDDNPWEAAVSPLPSDSGD